MIKERVETEEKKNRNKLKGVVRDEEIDIHIIGIGEHILHLTTRNRERVGSMHTQS